MSRRAKIWLGIASIWPIVFYAVFITGAVLMRGSSAHLTDEVSLVLFGILVLTALLSPSLIIFYERHMIRNDRISKDRKTLWRVLLLFGAMVVQPVYWYLHIWREPTPSTEAAGNEGVSWRRMRVPMGAAMLYAAVWLAMVMAYMNSGLWPPHSPDEFSRSMPLFMVVSVFHSIAVICVFGVTALCMAHAIGNKELSSRSRMVWAFVLFFFHMLVIPVYWYLYFWREPIPADTARYTA
jgi:hypothetical protein